MKEILIDELAYFIKQAKDKNQPQPIVFLGAGASATGNIPLASEIEQNILSQYADNPNVKKLAYQDKSYAKLMKCLSPYERNELLKGYIAKAKINVTHIYLAQLIKTGYVDYVLTVNFDNLMLRALALLNVFPSTYDMAILNNLTTTTFKKQSVVYLHGQHHGLWLLNTDDEMARVQAIILRIFDSIKNERPWIFIGYSGSDPILEHIKSLGRFDNGLYWVGYKDSKPNEKVQQFLNDPNTNASYIKGYDADAFMLKLNEALNLDQPEILKKPFTSLKTLLDEINDINDEDHFKGVKERLEINKKWVDEAIKQYELNEEVTTDQRELQVANLKKDIIDLLISENYDETEISSLGKRVNQVNDEGINSLFGHLHTGWGDNLSKLAENKTGNEAEELYQKAFEKYQKASRLNPDDDRLYNNWGISLVHLAKIKSGNEAEKLYLQACEKYQKASRLNPDDDKIYNNWGNSLFGLAQIKSGNEAEELYLKAFEKYQKASSLNPDNDNIYNNWGNSILYLAQIKSGNEAEKLYLQASEKHKKASSINPHDDKIYQNLGISLSNLAQKKSGNEAEELYLQAFEKYQKAYSINPDDDSLYQNWGTSLFGLAQIKSGNEAKKLYLQACEKYQKASSINPHDYSIYQNWGISLVHLAQIKSGNEAEKLYLQASEKYQKAYSINPHDYNVYQNWGNSLSNLAQIKSGNEAEKLYLQASEKYQKASSLNPHDYKIYQNWGNSLLDLAQIKSGNEAEKLYLQACEKYQKASSINPHDDKIYYTWGNSLLYLAQIKSGNKAEKLYLQASEKYQKASSINPVDYKIYNNWGSSLFNLAQIKSGNEAEKLYQQAFEKLNKVVELSGRHYNLACLYAIRNMKEDALYHLDIVLANKEIIVSFVQEDEDWKSLHQDSDFQQLLEKYK